MRLGSCSCLLSGLLAGGLLALLLAAAYFLAPFRTTFLVLGIDRVPDGTALGRSDTMILVSVNPLWPEVTLLSIPRDLWVTIPGVGENRINTAHFFAEAEQEGSGPAAAAGTVEANFGVAVPYYARVRFDAFLRVVDAMGGVTVNLPSDMAGLPAGQHHLDGTQALAFVRDRQNADDFYRMEHTQFMVRAIGLQLLKPASWSRLPAVISAGLSSIDTNLPVWLWPRLGLALVRAGISGFDSHTISRDMVTPHTTEGGAAVLLPDWERINPMMDDLFGD
jgi:LCP family protein required for cell wall assembly